MQQVESPLLKASLIRLNRKIKRSGLDARIVTCIHDSIWVEAAEYAEKEGRKVMAVVMTSAVKLDAPMEVDFD